MNRQATLKGWNQESLNASTFAVVGLGALGGNLVLNLVRYGIGELWLFDDDMVEPSNFPRQPYYYSDVGLNKAIAIKHHVLNARIDRCQHVKAFPFRFENAVGSGLIPSPEILFVGVDNDPSRRWAITYASQKGIPAIITGIDSESGEGYVFIQKSRGDTPCPACFWPNLATSMAQAPCAPMSAAIAHTIVGISLAAVESLTMDRPLHWDVKTISLFGGVEGNYKVRKRANCPLCGTPSHDDS